MSLRPDRQVQQTNIDFPCPYTQERGGILSWSTVLYAASGINFVEYAFNPSGVKQVGLQLNDLENVNFSLQPFQQYIRDTDIPFTRVGIATEGDYTTDWIYPVGQIQAGDLAYAGPSGMITNTASFGGQQIGKFLGPLMPERHLLTLRGLGFSKQYTDPVTKQLIWENNPANRLLLVSEGYIKVRIHF